MFDFFYSKKKIKNLEKKLEGKLPVTKEELFILVNKMNSGKIFETDFKNSIPEEYLKLRGYDNT